VQLRRLSTGWPNGRGLFFVVVAGLNLLLLLHGGLVARSLLRIKGPGAVRVLIYQSLPHLRHL
jgi:hypothetical protein